MAKSRFKTRLSKSQKRRNALVFIAVGIFAYAFTLGFCMMLDLYDGWTPAEVVLLTLALEFFILSMTLVPVLLVAVALGVQMGRAKRVKDNVTFAAVQGIDYYRDSLKGLSPPLASLLIDLDLYGKKDMAATLLRMMNKGAVCVAADGRLGIAMSIEQTGDASAYNLEDYELEMLAIVSNGRLKDKHSLAAWKANRFKEAERAGLIQRQNVDRKQMYRWVYLACALLLVVFVAWGAFLANDLYRNPPVTIAVLLAIDLALFVPWYLAVRQAVYYRRGDVVWQRTELGNATAEKIAGLGRFIHEFSLLSEADKEQVALWDDYLVYAVVLEENERIVADIGRRYGLGRLGLRSLDRLHLLRW